MGMDMRHVPDHFKLCAGHFANLASGCYCSCTTTSSVTTAVTTASYLSTTPPPPELIPTTTVMADTFRKDSRLLFYKTDFDQEEQSVDFMKPKSEKKTSTDRDPM